MKKLEKDIKAYLRARNWHMLRPSDIAKSISIEAAELLELFQWQSLDIKATKKDKEKIGENQRRARRCVLYAIEMAVLLDLIPRRLSGRSSRVSKKNILRHLCGRSRVRMGLKRNISDIKREYRAKGN